MRPIWSQTSILDNSPHGNLGERQHWPVPIIRPSVPLSCAQSMNFLYRLAAESSARVFGYQHEDAEASEGTAEAFFRAVTELKASACKWSAILTQYDILSAYSVSAVADIGPWDTAFPDPNYHIDIDWFHRARLKGYELVQTDLPVSHLDGGSVTRREPWRAQVHAITNPFNAAYYAAKWGAGPHRERFGTAWNAGGENF